MSFASVVSDFVKTYGDPKVNSRFFIGFSCGVPFLLRLTILDLWLKDCGVSNTAIGLFTLLNCPFTFKFLWALFIDRFNFPFLSEKFGRRKGWAIASQILLFIGICGMACSTPKDGLLGLIICASVVAFADGCQDMSLYKYQIRDTQGKMLGPIAGVVIFGYRIGMFLSKSLSLYLAHYFGWNVAYFAMALTILLCMFFILNIEEPQEDAEAKEPLNFSDNVDFSAAIKTALDDCLISPFKKFMEKGDWKRLIWIIVLYRAGDMIAQKMAKPFFVEIGFSMLEIANVVQVFGTISTLIGGICGGYFVKKVGIKTAMFYTAIAHAVSCLTYVAMSFIGYNIHMLYFTAFIENITGGMMSTAFIAFLYSLCNKQYGTTQYALLWAFYDFGGAIYRTISGAMADLLGWTNFFIFAVIMFIPGIVVLYPNAHNENRERLEKYR